MKNIIILIFMTLMSVKSVAQFDRIVYFLHGLGGSAASWEPVSARTKIKFPEVPGYPARRAYTLSLDYQQFDNSLLNAANSLDFTMLSAFNTVSSSYGFSNQSRNNNFIIAHSQGGIVGRRLDQMYSQNPFFLRQFGGLVTFGSPHQGARILNNVDFFGEFISSGCEELTAGPIKEKVENSFFLKLLISDNNVKSVVKPICSFFGNDLVPLVLKSYTSPIAQEYQVGHEKITDLNNFASNIPKVAFYGEEEESTVLWRSMYNIIKQKPEQLPIFGADDDTELLNNVKFNIAQYQSEVWGWQDAYDDLTANGYCTWWEWILSAGFGCYIQQLWVDAERAQALELRNEWQKGLTWWNTANDKYRIIIGAKTSQGITTTGYECNCTDYDYDGNSVNSWTTTVTDINDCVGNGWLLGCSPTGNTTDVTVYQEIDKPSDGVVLAESAMNFPQGASPLPTKSVKMVGSNHMQMRNDSNTKARLNELFNGAHGDYFRTLEQ